MSTLRTLMLALPLCLVTPAGHAAFASAPATQPATKEAGNADHPGAALEQFYANLYGDQDNFETRLGGLVSVVSLSRYAGKPLTDRLFMAGQSGDSFVAQAAWEALAARAGDLNAEDLRRWQDLGLGLATGRQKNEVFLGTELRPLLLALAGRAPERDVPKFADLVNRALAQNDATTDAGRATLEAAGQALKAWGEPSLVTRLVRDVTGKGAAAERTAVVLGQLPGAPAADASAGDWRKWATGLKLQPEPLAYTAGSTWFDAPVVINDPNDPKFRKEVELGDLAISGVDVVFAIDATGSLETSNEYIRRYLTVLMQTLTVVSDNARAGIIYYRHEIRPDLQVDCCREAAANKDRNAFLVDPVALTKNFDGLLAAMAVDRLKGARTGHDDGRGALAAGLDASVQLLDAQSRKNAARVVVLQADADPTRGSEETLLKMAGAAREMGVVPVLLIRDASDARRLEATAEAAMGRPAITYRDDLEALKDAPADLDPYADFAEKPLGEVAALVIGSALPEDYRDRGDGVVRLVAAHLEAAYAARQAAGR